MLKPLQASFAIFVWVSASASQAAELVYLGASWCGVCRVWEKEVGSIYPKTQEAKILPLRKLEVSDPLPQDLAFLDEAQYTPTFVVVEDGREVGRIVGYTVDYFFWGELSSLIKKMDKASVSGPDS